MNCVHVIPILSFIFIQFMILKERCKVIFYLDFKSIEHFFCHKSSEKSQFRSA